MGKSLVKMTKIGNSFPSLISREFATKSFKSSFKMQNKRHFGSSSSNSPTVYVGLKPCDYF